MTTISTPDIQLQMGTSWTQVANPVSHKAYTRDPISIRTGRSNWSGSVDPGSARFTLDSRDHAWAPDDVSSAFWHSYARNIPCRIGVPHGTTFLESQGVANGGGSGASCPSSVALQLTGTMTAIIEYQLYDDPLDDTIANGQPTLSQYCLMEKWSGGGGAGWRLGLVNHLGKQALAWWWIDNGGTPHAIYSWESGGGGGYLPYWSRYRRITVKVDFEPSPVGRVTFWWGTGGVSGSFTSIGAPIFGALTTLKADTAIVRISGNADSFNWRPFPGRTFAAKILNSGGSTVASPVFEGATAGAASVTDAQGNVFTMGSGGRITNVRWRYSGELASLPIASNLRGNDTWASVQAHGILARLRQGQPVLDSAIRRYITHYASSIVGYWPCEDIGQNANRLALAAPSGGGPFDAPATDMIVEEGFPQTGANREFVASAAIPTCNGTRWVGQPVIGNGTGEWEVRWLLSMPPTATGAGNMLDVGTTGSYAWYIAWQAASGGQLKIVANDANTAAVVYDSGWISFDLLGKPIRMSFTIKENAGNLDVTLQGTDRDYVLGGFTAAAAAAGTAGQINVIRVNGTLGLTDTAIGHILATESINDPATMVTELLAYDGELAGARIQRLCAEEGIPLRIVGDPADTQHMSFQLQHSVMDLLQQCADVDLGILGEAREVPALQYRCRTDMTAQTAAFNLNHTGGEVNGVVGLVRDQQGFVNSWEIKAESGISARATLADGSRVSISNPPVGTGKYASSATICCRNQEVIHEAYTYLRFTAVDQPRVENLQLDLAKPPLDGNTSGRVAILESKLGDLVTVTNVPNYTGTLSQIVQGVTEQISDVRHVIGYLTTSGQPWSTGIIDDATYTARADTDGSTLAAAASAGATSLSVASSGILWTTAGGDLPFDVDINGVRVHVTAISGAGSPQTFTVTAISRALPLGAVVQLADPTFVEL